MPQGNKNKILLFLAVFTVLIIAVSSLNREETAFNVSSQGEHYSITLTDDGFTPRELTVHIGDRVTFRTERGKEFWPASDLHPTHTIYSEFDPRRPIPPDETWSFTFDRVGVWNLHDHLSPNYRGTITVLDGVSDASVSDCSADLGEKQNCWQKNIESAIDTGGVDAAFTLFGRYYEGEPDFSPYCHDFMHIIGDAAYSEFAETGKTELNEYASYCAYGFYHGFLEAMVYTTGDVSEARDFCTYAQRERGGDTEGACYHGIGHGIADGSDPRTWGDAEAMISASLALCEDVGVTEYFVNRCASGVFNSLGIFYDNPDYEKYDLHIDRADPYAICRVQKKEYFRTPCYQELDTTVLRLNDWNLKKGLDLAQNIKDDGDSAEAVESLVSFSFWNDHNKMSDEEAVALCRSLEGRSVIPCLKGFSTGLIEFDSLKNKYRRGILFCEHDLLSDNEVRECFERTIPYVRRIVDSDGLREVCAGLEISNTYRDKLCNAT